MASHSPAPARGLCAQRSSVALAALLLLVACDQKKEPSETSGAPSAVPAPKSQLPGELSDEQRRAVLAKVGDRVITLGQFVETLERMDPFERARYQSPERRKQLLDQMIEVELLG